MRLADRRFEGQTRTVKGRPFCFPTKEYVESVKVGWLIMNPYGSTNFVHRILARGTTEDGRAYVAYSAWAGDSGYTFEGILTQDTVVLTEYVRMGFNAETIREIETSLRIARGYEFHNTMKLFEGLYDDLEEVATVKSKAGDVYTVRVSPDWDTKRVVRHAEIVEGVEIVKIISRRIDPFLRENRPLSKGVTMLGKKIEKTTVREWIEDTFGADSFEKIAPSGRDYWGKVEVNRVNLVAQRAVGTLNVSVGYAAEAIVSFHSADRRTKLRVYLVRDDGPPSGRQGQPESGILVRSKRERVQRSRNRSRGTI